MAFSVRKSGPFHFNQEQRTAGEGSNTAAFLVSFTHQQWARVPNRIFLIVFYILLFSFFFKKVTKVRKFFF